MYNLFRYVGIRHLRIKPVRTLLTTIGVALGVALFIAIGVINQSTLNSFRENIDAVAGKATLIVSAGEMGFAEDKVDLITKIPGVKSTVPMIESRAYFAGPDKASETLMILGVDLLKEQAVRTYKTTDEQVIDDPLTFLNQPDSIILTHSFAQKHGLKMDSVFELATARGKQKFTVRGLLSPEGPAKAYGGSIALMDIDGARMTFAKENKVDRVDIVTKKDEDVNTVLKRVQDTLGKGYKVERPEGQSEGMERMVKSYQTMMAFFSSLALLVGLFLITNSISISVAERKREIGTLRALGATRRGILILFISEAVAMGALGAFVGAWLGRGLAGVLVKLIAQGMSSQYLTKIEVTKLQFDSADVIRAVLIGTVAALIAAAWPSYKATRIQPLEAMRRQEVGEDAGRRGFFKYSPWLGFAMLLYVSIVSALQVAKYFPLVENINQGVAMLGAALLGPALVTVLLRALRPAVVKSGRTVTRLAQDNLLRNPRRTASNVMSLMIGLMLVILISIVNMSFRKTMGDWFERVLRADLLVSSNGTMISYQVQPLHEDLGKDLARIPGIQVPSNGSMYALRFVHIQYEGRQLGLKAYDEPEPEIKYGTIDVLDRPREEAGRELYHSADPTVMVSENFVLHFHKKTGETLTLDTPAGPVNFRIIAVLVDFASPEGVLYMSRETYKRFWKDPLVSAFGIHVLPGTDPHQVRGEIDRRFGQAKNLMVMSNRELRDQMTETIDRSFAGTRAIEMAALLVGLLGLLNTMLISVMERMRELGMLRAVGMSRRQVSRMILQESVFQGVLGAVVAAGLGGWLAYTYITNSLAHVLGWIIHYHFPWSAIGTTTLVGLTVALIAGFFPARRAAHLEIREALEYE